MNDRRLAGIGGIVFGVLFAGGMITGSPPGGDYDAGDVADFIAKGHRSAVVTMMALLVLAVVGLLLVTAYLCETSIGKGRLGRISWGTSLLAAASFLIGAVVLATPSMSLAVGGGPDIDTAVNYTITQIGFGVMFLAGGAMLGVSLLALSIGGHRTPTWVRIFSAAVGILALFSILFFPFFAVLLWGLVIGIWLLVSTPTARAESTV